MRYIVVLLIAILMGVNGFSADFPKSTERKIAKSLTKVWPGVDYERVVVAVNKELIDKYKLPDLAIYKIIGHQKVMGYMGLSWAEGRSEKFDYLVIFDNKMSIRRIVILVYRSSYGQEVTAQSWLKQFYGKRNGKKMEYDKDIDIISGATLSAPSLTEGVKSMSQLIVEMLSN